ncbi:protein kinase domain-containing protein [Ferrimonas senticii]|uniref:protein kinase domain-containing protein n=1 Tax=Ferrimonas senticii TaxID=394566 RepID=UPI00040A81DE|nr:protein kinase [Ferrimonas senticii]
MSSTSKPPLQQFYIAEEQSIYLLKQDDADKLRQWQRLCQQQLRQLGYRHNQLIGKGVFGFVFAGQHPQHGEQVFKFARRTLAPALQQRLRDEAEILSQLQHPNIPAFSDYVEASGQPILQMARAEGRDLAQLARRSGRLPLHYLMAIGQQLAELLGYLRALPRPIVHGDIKPANLLFEPRRKRLSLVDWGSAVLAQQDAQGHAIGHNLGHYDGLHGSNARMGDSYFIGNQQLQGLPSSPRFDEQGAAATLYALASGQISRFGQQQQPASSLGLPKPLAQILDGLLGDDPEQQRQAGDHFIATFSASAHWHLPPLPQTKPHCLLPLQRHQQGKQVETVVYSSRKSFLLANQPLPASLSSVDLQAANYYRDFLQGMGDNEKGLVVALGQLGQYPLLGGLVLHWHSAGVDIDCSLQLQDPTLTTPVTQVINNLVQLAQAVRPQQSGALFKACFFDARDTLHLQRRDAKQRFSADSQLSIPFTVEPLPQDDVQPRSQLHSYFEDGRDTDETLTLPASIMSQLGQLNLIHHSGCIIFEALEDHLKIHSCLQLHDRSRELAFKRGLQRLLAAVADIDDIGIAGFMKLPYKNTRRFGQITTATSRYYPKDPKRQAL